MQVHLKGFTSNNNDAIIAIQCECGSRYMLDESGEFQAEELFVYRHGVPVKNLRCSSAESETLVKAVEEGPPCQERYRIILHNHDSPSALEVAHVTPRPREEVLERQIIQFPPKKLGTDAPHQSSPSTEYVRMPYC